METFPRTNSMICENLLARIYQRSSHQQFHIPYHLVSKWWWLSRWMVSINTNLNRKNTMLPSNPHIQLPVLSTRQQWWGLNNLHVHLISSYYKAPMTKSVEIPQDIIDNVIVAVGDDTHLLKQCTLVSSSFLLPSRKQLFSRITLRNDQTCQGIYNSSSEIQSFSPLSEPLLSWTIPSGSGITNFRSGWIAIRYLPFSDSLSVV